MSLPFPPQNCPFTSGDLDPLSNAWFLEPTRVNDTNGIIGKAVYARLTTQTDDRPTTDHATGSVTIDRIYVRTTAVRCGLIYTFIYHEGRTRISEKQKCDRNNEREK